MNKILTLLRRPATLDAEPFAKAILEVGRMFFASPGSEISHCTINIVDTGSREGVMDPKRPPPTYDAALETWWTMPPVDAHRRLGTLLREAGSAHFDAHSYVVEETVQKDCARTWPIGDRSPGIKGVYTVGRRADLSREQFARHWHNGHGPLAHKHHVGMARYVQNVTVERLSPDAPDFDGFATLHFLTAADMWERFYDSPEGAKLIAEDVRRFIGSPSVQMNLGEYILR